MWEEHGANLCVDSEAGDKAATDAAFARAAHVVRLETAINRVTGVPMELRAAIGVYDPSAPRYTVYTSAGGGVVRQRDDIAAVLGVPTAAVRVVSGRCRRQFRHPQQHLSGIRAGCLGGETGRAAGQMVVRAP